MFNGPSPRTDLTKYLTHLIIFNGILFILTLFIILLCFTPKMLSKRDSPRATYKFFLVLRGIGDSYKSLRLYFQRSKMYKHKQTYILQILIIIFTDLFLFSQLLTSVLPIANEQHNLKIRLFLRIILVKKIEKNTNYLGLKAQYISLFKISTAFQYSRTFIYNKQVL